MKRENQQCITLLIKQNSIVLACAEFGQQTILTGTLLKELAPAHTFIDGRIYNFGLALSTLETYLRLTRYHGAVIGLIFDTSLIIDSFALPHSNLVTGNALSSYHTRTLTFQRSSQDMPVNYTAAIGCDLLLQYELLCSELGLSLVFASTPLQAYARMYRVLYGAAFRHSLLLDAVEQHGSNIDLTIDQTLLSRFIKQPAHQVNARDNMLCIGSFYCMRDLLV